MRILKSKWLLPVIAALLALFAVYLIFFRATRIAYVDSAKLLTGYNAMVAARSEFEAKKKVWESNIDSLTNDVRNAIGTYEKTAALGTEKEKQLSKELIGTKQKQLQDYQNAIRQNAAQEEQRLSQSVLTTVNAFLSRFGKTHGYKMILVAANGNIAYADPALDITDKVVEQLNKEYAVPVKK
ncbi:OmpH family outer membrane protein [Niabella sp. CC-SYL272]|uniref:OmpH family outer membrane protein n=1 Tax=Niabella agricola TaxID=2891571 RepID=UPI001F2DCC5D|nr:OmpH family outer membrane protein [Niabella agricola]MCF3107871.1 OmpH family outer membrane protein [Niabella agricola]